MNYQGLMTAVIAAATSLLWVDSARAAIPQIEHRNGSLIALNGETLPVASGELFPVEAGGIIEFGRGFTDFALFPDESEDTLWQVEIFPGDSFATFCLGAECTTVDEPAVDLTQLPAGPEALTGNIIAYGFDPEGNPSVRLTSLGSESDPEAVPEPSVGIAAFLALAAISRVLR